jgi:heparinase II/III-like protein
LLNSLKVLSQLGLAPVALNALYRLGVKTGWFKASERGRTKMAYLSSFLFALDLPSREALLSTIGDAGSASLLAEADEMVVGKVRLFGAEPVELQLSLDRPLAHWTAYETKPALLSQLQSPVSDIKFIWEPARFGFALALGRAYHLTGDEKYAAAFWQYFEAFSGANPPYLGPNWMSGQEVALRLMAFVWAAQVFAASQESSPERMSALAAAVAAHAGRIPPTLVYARSQNNNHLLTEAAGLFTASLSLPDHPHAPVWRHLGVEWLNWCFEHQIDATGEYIQHSTNYHRLMLQTALWVSAVTMKSRRHEQETLGDFVSAWLSPRAKANLSRATSWLLALTDPETGRVPNLGANDGANIFRLSSLPFEDFRPALQAAALVFRGRPAFPPGPWDEPSIWLANEHLTTLLSSSPDYHLPLTTTQPPSLQSPTSKVYLRIAHYTSRPSHADQLHVDLWWRGQNVALDPGTYRYNADPPWDNALTTALVHNTVTVDGLDQMTRAGKFLYLDWAQARVLEQDAGHISAEHNGYRRLGVVHRRTVTALEAGWRVVDQMHANGHRVRTFRLHWLLRDGEWKMEERAGKITLVLHAAGRPIVLTVSAPGAAATLVRAGEFLHGTGPADPVRGWMSPTYGLKVPALSLALAVESTSSITIGSEFTFPADD